MAVLKAETGIIPEKVPKAIPSVKFGADNITGAFFLLLLSGI